MRAFIVGGTELMGPSLVDELEMAGHEALCFNRRGRHPREGTSIKGDRNDAGRLRGAILDSKPDVVIDMIPYTEEQAIAHGEIIEEVKCPLLACSSIDVYQAYNILHRIDSPPYQTCPLKESNALRTALSIEGKKYDKLNVERVYLSLGVDVTIFRLPAIYGWPDTRRTKLFVDPMLKGEEVKMSEALARWRFSRAFNRNCAYAISLGLDRSGKRVYNVAERTPHTHKEWCEKIGNHLNWNGEIVYDNEIGKEADLGQDWFVDTEAIRQELGFDEKYDCDAGLREAIDKYVESERMIFGG